MNKKKIEESVKVILEAIGENPKREGLKETPRRVAEMYEEIFSGIKKEVKLKVLKGENHDEIILMKDIPLYSVCEHHLLPFIGKSHVAYIPAGGRITGFSKLVRLVDTLSKKLQVQERLTTQIAEIIMDTLKPKGVLVIIEAEHLCMTMRGINKPGTLTITSAVRGIFRKNPKTRAEALSLIRGEK